ncbi:hypothetical protein RRG08_027273 [Elysia crispata]|uniref:Uncharacterized protein n=1 Tax=Elysia crispata TaxID=231223 RepID=A0AAE1B766_9GAST|nr:hypothetical protein RRG08_027273 [Elysia crispata]
MSQLSVCLYDGLSLAIGAVFSIRPASGGMSTSYPVDLSGMGDPRGANTVDLSSFGDPGGANPVEQSNVGDPGGAKDPANMTRRMI